MSEGSTIEPVVLVREPQKLLTRLMRKKRSGASVLLVR